jgi:predicted amidophosphoribosyltransferase
LTTERLTLIDEISRADHPCLAVEDRCFYFGEFFARGDHLFGATGQLIVDYQCRPSVAAAKPARRAQKERALAAIADRMRALIAQSDAECCTWVPVPPANATDHPDYDDRLARALRAAFSGYDADVRAILRVAEGDGPVSGPAPRLNADQVYQRLWVDVDLLRRQPLRTHVVLFDDVIATGTHYHAAARRLREVVPVALPILGVFFARHVLENPAEPEQ